MSRTRIAVLVSGRGSNMAALLRATLDPDYPADIALVVSNVPSAGGILHAQEQGVPFKVIDHKTFDSREDHEDAVTQALKEAEIEFVCLAGYMRILSERFIKNWRGRLINIHPSLLPAFVGVDTHARAMERGVRVHGCTVHFVTGELDAGPIIAQRAVAVQPDDTEEALAARVLAQEQALYPLALQMVIEKRVRWSGDNAVVINGAIGEDLSGLQSD
ncbi:MAG: phosphoribosylglycinamide formyltransferase [Pseudomonadota bacterium]